MTRLVHHNYDITSKTEYLARLTENYYVSAKPKQENLNELKQELDIDFHKIPLSDLYQRLGTNAETGLTNAQVKSNQVSSPAVIKCNLSLKDAMEDLFFPPRSALQHYNANNKQTISPLQ